MNKELRKLIGELVDQGYEVSRTKGNHYTVRKGGRRIATLASSASDWRSMKNALSAIRRYERGEQ